MRPFRFGLQAARVIQPRDWTALARTAEAGGYSSLMVPDHLGRLATFPALMAAAAVTQHIKLSTYVLNQDWRPPAILAQEAASVQLLTGGRLELGIGAGWAKHEYLQAGIRYDSAGARVDRFAEYLGVVKGILHAQEAFSFEGAFFHVRAFQPMAWHTPPPIVVGGGSPNILKIAGRLSDIISISTRASADGRVDMSNIRLEAVEKKLEFIRAGAQERFKDIELNMTVREVRVTGDRRAAAGALLDEWSRAPQRYANVDQLTVDDLLDSPHEAIGTAEQIVQQLEAARERWGINYIEVSSGDAEAIAPVVQRLAGT